MSSIVIVGCACLVLGFLFGRMTARVRGELRLLRAETRPRDPKVQRDPIVLAPIDIRRSHDRGAQPQHANGRA